MKKTLVWLSLILNVLLIAAGTYTIHKVAARDLAEQIGIVETRRPPYTAFAEERFQGLPGVDVTLIGDSQIERGPWSEVLNRPVANRGQSGKFINEVTADIPNDVNPSTKNIVIWAGTNDVISQAHGYTQIREDMEQLLQAARAQAPNAKLTVLTIPPVEPHSDLVKEANRALEDSAKESGATLVDTFSLLTNEIAHDGVHLKGTGYTKIAPSIADAIV